MSIPEEGIAAAVEVMRGGRLFRYCATSAETSHVAQAEKEFAAMVNQKYALGVNSCSSAIMLALMAVGVDPGDHDYERLHLHRAAVNDHAFGCGARPRGSHRPGPWTSMTSRRRSPRSRTPKCYYCRTCAARSATWTASWRSEKNGITFVEDCAHSCGVTWRGKQLGYHARVTAYSTQSDKVINSGEGGFITTDDDEIAAKIIYLSGCYERRYGKHAVRPADELCEVAMAEMPNLSCRMNEVTAAVMRPLIKNLPQRVEDYNRRYDSVVKVLREEAGDIIVVPTQDERVGTVGDHLNFYLTGVTDEQNALFRQTCVAMGVPVSWFQSQVNARWHVNWRKYGSPTFDLPNTDEVLRFAYDLKMPPYFDDADFPAFARVIAYAARVAAGDDDL